MAADGLSSKALKVSAGENEGCVCGGGGQQWGSGIRRSRIRESSAGGWHREKASIEEVQHG